VNNDPGRESTAADPLVRYDRDGAVARITLNRPAKLNAFNDQMVRDLAAALRHFDLDDDARAAVLIGAGRAFSAGADVVQRQARPTGELAALASPEAWDADSSQLLTRAVHWKPVVAAVHGYALGMAFGLAIECEMIIAAWDVKFQVTETVRGLSPTRYWELLCWRTSEGFATRAALLAPWIEAGEALDAHLVQRCVAPDELWDAAAETAGRLADLPPGGIQAAVRARRHRIREINERCRYDNELHRLHLSQDFSASVSTFLARPHDDQKEA
jgi:enoyl-CoA hydratase/carnithine racemase